VSTLLRPYHQNHAADSLATGSDDSIRMTFNLCFPQAAVIPKEDNQQRTVNPMCPCFSEPDISQSPSEDLMG